MTELGFEACRKKRRTCNECMWNWPNLRTGKELTDAERVCYMGGGRKYHEEAQGGCELYEKKVREKLTLNERYSARQGGKHE